MRFAVVTGKAARAMFERLFERAAAHVNGRREATFGPRLQLRPCRFSEKPEKPVCFFMIRGTDVMQRLVIEHRGRRAYLKLFGQPRRFVGDLDSLGANPV